MATRQNLTLTNTFFKHKMCHRTTWTSTEKPNSTRKNPYRNQIDNVITRINTRKMICDSRSYTNQNINSDHKLVKINIKWKWWKMYNKPIKVKWFYEKDDDDMELEGNIFKGNFQKLNFEIIGEDDLDNI